MTFRVFDQKYSQRLYWHNDLEVQFQNHEAEVPASIAYHMSRMSTEKEFFIEQKYVPFHPDSWKKEKRMIWSCNISSANGFGMVAENTIIGLRKLGVTVLNPAFISGTSVSGGKFVDEEARKALGTNIEPDCLEIQHCQPPAFKTSIVERKWIYTMFETTHTPRRWIDMLNRTERILVPSQWLVKSWKEQGVTVPIDVVGHGIDPAVYHYVERPARDRFVFLHYGRLSLRKGTDLVIRAFKEEFAQNNDAYLILKDTIPFEPLLQSDPLVQSGKIIQLSITYSKPEMLEFLQNADCLVFPTRGEGFGLPPLEALATGLPTIVTNWGGCADFVHKEDTLLLDYSMSRSTEFDQIYEEYFEAGEHAGEWAEPQLEHLKAHMRWCYNNREKALAMGKKAAERIVREWTWATKMQQLYDIIDKHI